MRNVIYKMLTGCYMVAALLLVGACNDDVDIQQSYPFRIETMPVPKKLKVGETAEIRCQLHRDGRFEETRHFIRYFGFIIPLHQPTSKRWMCIFRIASGSWNNLRFHLIMITIKKNRGNKNGNIGYTPCISRSLLGLHCI